jgi:hypothetical protein
LRPYTGNHNKAHGILPRGFIIYMQYETITVKNNGSIIASGKVNADGNYTIAISPQKAGTVLKVSATDAEDNQSEEASITIQDRTAPKAPKITRASS